MASFALLSTALLFGGMVLYSFGFAAFLLTALPPDVARPTIRRAFPLFYVFVMVTAAISALLTWPSDPMSALMLALIVITTVPTRQILMPAINRATDRGEKSKFKWLHGASVIVTFIHILISAWILVRFLPSAGTV